ncbi:uncharacterized protein A4U43_C01F25950 [Asparagus officinalis]|uniref:DDT domain-containing protein n=1 Tax=Asparagus officinalis TaxID=4686 RepID=A0A5P1FU13_ASPOF|nr:DDT domain-containing protein DDB_G0282237-like [Asparagus officinalis]ONK81163.1 uncharacterized protein A4U43_C01F25950 [Asparagus officinalis]
MPLLKKKPFSLLEPPKDLSPDEQVWQIRFTHEIFRDYSVYLERMNLYRRRIWACRITARTNMTYEEALVSELEAIAKLRRFPEEFKGFVLQNTQFSMLKINDLATMVIEKLRETLLPGEELLGHIDNCSGPCKIKKVLGGKGGTAYEVGWLSDNKEVTKTSVLDKKNLIRKKFPFSRELLKLYIKESTLQTNPWVVQNNLVKMYGLPTKPPHGLEEKITKHQKVDGVSTIKKTIENIETDQVQVQTNKSTKRGKQSKLEEIVYPIEDLLVKPSRDDPEFTKRPVPSVNFIIPVADVGNLLMVWDFLSCLGKTLHLSPFSLDDFEKAIAYDGVSNLIAEAHIALLTLLVNEEGEYYVFIQQKKREEKIIMNTWLQYLCDFLELESRSKFTDHILRIKEGKYGGLHVHDKLEILSKLVHWAISAEAIRNEIDKCIEKQRDLMANKREEDLEELRMKREEKRLKKEIVNKTTPDSMTNHAQAELNGDVDMKNPSSIDVNNSGNRGSKLEVLASRRALMMKNLTLEKEKESSRKKELQKLREESRAKEKEARERKLREKRSELYEQEIEKSHIWTSALGKDCDHNTYWFFRRDGRIFVESSDHNQWGFFSSKDELDTLISSLNPKGQRELALKRRLEKRYTKICSALQKRSKEMVRKVVLEDTAILRRSVRVSATPRNETPSFLQYVNKL